jgi:hypothetical protein
MIRRPPEKDEVGNRAACWSMLLTLCRQLSVFNPELWNGRMSQGE